MREIIAAVLLLTAMVFDVRQKRIPNGLCLSGGVLCLAITMATRGAAETGSCIVAVFFVIALCWPLFLLRAVGAGDIKLLGMLCTACDLECFLRSVLVFLMLSGVGSVAVLLRRGIFGQRMRYLLFYTVTGRKDRRQYYDKLTDGTEMTMILTPFLFAAYLIVLAGRWCQAW